MNRMRIVCCTTLLLLAASVFAADNSLPQLFKQAKDKFTAGDYKSSLADLDALDAISAQPGHENDRAKLLPVLTFYRGANLAALGQKEEAREAFASFLTISPNGSIASPPFPKSTVDLFEDGRRMARGRSTSMSTVYSAFTTPAGWTLPPDEHWIESPVRSENGIGFHADARAEEGVLDVYDERRARLVHRSVLETTRSDSDDGRERIPQ